MGVLMLKREGDRIRRQYRRSRSPQFLLGAAALATVAVGTLAGWVWAMQGICSLGGGSLGGGFRRFCLASLERQLASSQGEITSRRPCCDRAQPVSTLCHVIIVVRFVGYWITFISARRTAGTFLHFIPRGTWAHLCSAGGKPSRPSFAEPTQSKSRPGL